MRFICCGAALISLLTVASAWGQPSVFQRRLGEELATLSRNGGSLKGMLAMERAMELAPHLPVGHLAARLEPLVQAKGLHPLLQARLRYHLAKLNLDQGQAPLAKAMIQGLGLIDRWMVVGPFDDESKGGFDKPFPPEADPWGQGEMAGKERPVHWRPLGQANLLGQVDLASVIRPTEKATAYARAQLHSPKDRTVALRVGSNGAIKVWVNGSLALENPVYRRGDMDQDAVAIPLSKGWNTLLVKVCQQSGPWSFSLRLTTLDGHPLDNLSVRAEAQASLPQARARSLRAPPTLPTPLAFFEEAAARSPSSAEARANLAFMLHRLQGFDPEEKRPVVEMERAVAMEPTARRYITLSRLYGPDDLSMRRLALEQALKLDPKEVDGLFSLGRHCLSADLRLRAARLFRQALTLEPTYFPASHALAQLNLHYNLQALSLSELEKLVQSHPGVVSLALDLALAYEQGQYYQRQEEVLLGLKELGFAGVEVHRALADIARRKLDVEGEVGALRAILELEPDDVSTMADLAELLEANGRGEEALGLMARGLEICPEDARLLERRGNLEARSLRFEEAAGFWRQALLIKPQNPSLKERLTYHVPAQASFADPYLVPLASFKESLHGKGKDGGATILLDQTIIKVHSNGLSSTYRQRVIRLENDKGVKDYTDNFMDYDPTAQRVNIHKARALKASGEVREGTTVSDQSLAESWYGMYFDYRSKVVTFPDLKAGDIIELQYVHDDIGQSNLFSDTFGTLIYLQGDEPKERVRVVLLSPQKRTIHENKVALSGLKRTETVRGETRETIFELSEVAKVEQEAGMPGFSEVAAYLHLSTYRTWEEVGRWYWGLVKDQMVVTPEMERLVKELTASAQTPMDKVVALHDYVAKKTRYVGLEFGIHGYKPYRTDQVLARKFGDCKDKASLLAVMLGLAGIKANLALIRTRRLGEIAVEPASLEVFNHAICYLPDLDIWIDGTAEFSGLHELPYQNQGAMALVVGENTAKLVRPPISQAQLNLVHRTSTIRLNPDGSATMDSTTTVSGDFASDYRSQFQTALQRKELMEKAWNDFFPGARLMALSFSDLLNLNAPVKVDTSLQIPHLARLQDKDLVLTLTGRQESYTHTYASLSRRTHDFLLSFPWQRRLIQRIILPQGLSIHALAKPRRIQSPFGHLSLAVSGQEGEIVIDIDLAFSQRRVQRQGYEEFRAFCRAVDDALNQMIVLRPR